MGIVTQETILFNDTIAGNIRLGKRDATDAEIETAARIANADEFIRETEHGYQTNVGDRGMKLSGGQRQRLSIARAVLKNPDILILDEATSALDTESEKLVQDALSALLKGRTSLVIAHDPQCRQDHRDRTRPNRRAGYAPRVNGTWRHLRPSDRDAATGVRLQHIRK